MKHFGILLFTVVLSVCQTFAYDHVIFRDGQEYDVKLHQITNEKIIYTDVQNKSKERQEALSADVYMVYIEKQGNIYLTSDGQRITGESKRVDPKKYDVIYLVNGGEIGANNIRITENDVQYSNKNKSGGIGGFIKKAEVEINSYPKNEVFMVRYKSGMVDVITPFTVEKEEIKEEVEDPQPQQPQYTVVFHAVKKGETLKTIAEHYNVTVEEIMEWNELSTKIKPTKPLTTGMQLMIYQPKQQEK